MRRPPKIGEEDLKRAEETRRKYPNKEVLNPELTIPEWWGKDPRDVAFLTWERAEGLPPKQAICELKKALCIFRFLQMSMQEEGVERDIQNLAAGAET